MANKTDSVGSSENDSSPLPPEVPQNSDHPNVTVPAKPMTDEALRIIGAGKAYNSPYHKNYDGDE